MKRSVRWTSGACALALTTAVLAGCVSSGGYAPGARYAKSIVYSARSVARSVVVENHSWNRVTVYLLNEAGATRRLGDVEAMEQETFAVAQLSDDGGGVHFVAHPLAGTSFASEGFIFPTGSTAIWTIENHAALSNVRVR